MTQRDATPEELALARKIAINLWPGDDTEYLFERDAARNAALSAIRETTVKVIKLAKRQQYAFLSPEYATGQPMSSFSERFACGQIIEALRRGDHLKQEAV